jgi:peroxiredoxin
MQLLALLALALAADDPAPDFTLKDVEGRTHTLSALKDRKAVVLLFTGIQCPRSVAAEPRLAEMARAYGEKGIAFLAVNSNWHESVEAVAAHAKSAKFPIPILKDEKNRVADLYKIEVQPTAVVLDAERRVRYRGLIDDHKNEEFVRNPYLRKALDALLEGRPVEVGSTEPVGCSVKREEAEAKGAEVTYAKHVAPILFRACVGCHRPGQVGPFSLETYEQAKAWSREVVTYSKRREMPPWKPVSNFGEYHNERRLSDDEIATLEKWHKAGAPKGDPKDLPPVPQFSDAWMLGKPDAVLKAEGGYEVAARGADEYRCYVMQNPFPEDVWVSGVEYRPGNPRAVHHIIAYLDMGTAGERMDAADPKPGYRSNGSGPNILPSGTIGGWAPGNLPRMLPDGIGRRLRKGERIILETHYHKTGRVEVDGGAELAIHLARKPVKQMLKYHMIINPMFRIPAGAEAHKVAGSWAAPTDVHVLDVMPHMHLLGREASMVATFPDGRTKDLVVIKDWDFNWQETYQFKEPLALARGTRVRLEMTYDNSLKNPNNPSNPPRDVRWGEQTTDEMCVGFIGFVRDSEDLTQPKTEDKK